jgi:glycosyltransferase involved in cell wall biosynthesis
MSTELAIVPAYNEAESIEKVLAELHEMAPGTDVLVINDGSTDDTASRALAMGAYVVTLPFNLGIGGAVQTGFRFAHERGYDRVVQVDGDGQHDAGELPKLRNHLASHPATDMVVGSRFLEEASGFRSSATRRVGIRIFARVLSSVLGVPITDPTSGFRMTGRRGIALFARDYPHDYPEVEALLMMRSHQLRSAEVQVTMRERQGGVSSITSLRSFYYMIKVTLALAVGILRVPPAVWRSASPTYSTHDEPA